MAGLTVNGFEKKTLEQIKREQEDRLRAIFGNQINLIAPSKFSQLVGIYSERESELWNLIEEMYLSRSPNSAQGVMLDKAVALTAISRLAATFSEIEVINLFGDVGTNVPIGTEFSVAGSSTSKFKTTTAATLVAGVDEIQRITPSGLPASGTFKLKFRGETTSALAFNCTATDIQNALIALNKIFTGLTVVGSWTTNWTVTFGGDNGKMNHPLIEVVDNTLQTSVPAAVSLAITELTMGVAQGIVKAIATVTGPIVSPAYSLTVIDTPVSGLTRVINANDGVVGRNVETDAALRIRRKDALQRSGSATMDAIRSKLLELNGVDEAFGLENITNAIDANGLPGKSIRFYIQGGSDIEIAQAIWNSKAGGIETNGTTTASAVDSQGKTQSVKFSRPAVVQIYYSLDITKESDFPSDGSEQIKKALYDYVNSLDVGKDVIVYPKSISAIGNIPGLIDIVIRVGTAVNPTLDNNVVIDFDKIARMAATSQVVVNIL